MGGEPGQGRSHPGPANLGPTKAAIARYAAIAAKGGWRQLPDVKLQLGTTHPAVALLRERLRLSGELKDEGSSSEYFDYDLDQAVRRYQAANGLAPTGAVDKGTIAAMNVPAASRLKQLRTNLARLGELAKTPKKYVAVNVPAAQIEVVENDAVVSRHAGIVGKIDRPDADPQVLDPGAQLQRRVAPAADRDREGPDPNGPEDGAARPERARQVQDRRLRRRRPQARADARSTGARRERRA